MNTKRATKPIATSNGATSRTFTGPTLGQYIIDRLRGLGVEHVFGIPGDYILDFYKMMEESPLRLVGTTNELCAGYAADAYARVRGLGVACVTYGVGGLSLTNAAACAYAEKSPVVVISGSPGMKERTPNVFLHHTVRDWSTQREVFEKLTVASCALEDPLTAFREIDRVLWACLRYKRPVYIEIPRDRVLQTPLYQHTPLDEKPQSDPHTLAEAVDEAVAMLRESKSPCVLAGVEIHRFALQDLVMKLAEKNNIPLSATLLGKSVFRESHPLYIGLYEAGMGRAEVTKFVEDSDCLLMLGAFMTDIDMGIFTQNFDEKRMIFATSEGVRIRRHHYHGLILEEFIRALGEAELPGGQRAIPKVHDPIYTPWEARPNTPLNIRRLFQKINSILDDNMIVIADIGDSLFAAADLQIKQRTEFISPSYYTSMGFSIPAAIGAQSADPNLRPIVLVGDGAFQMTCMELSSAVRQKFNPIVIVLNNKGYQTERFLLEGKFNDILDWRYHRLPEVLGDGWGFEVHTETDLEKAIQAALGNRDSFSLLNVHLPQGDTSPALRRLAEKLALRVRPQ
jgi:indolepyruvate decarboxylase